MMFWEQRRERRIRMSNLYKSLGITKQAFFQWKSRYELKIDKMGLILDVCNEVRKDHPGMGLRTIWEMELPSIGRDHFMANGMQLGLGIEQKKNYKRTTDSRGVTKFENKIKEIKLTTINQVWVSDISYYRVEPHWYYMTLIMDLFSRKIVGYSASRTLKTEDTTIQAINYALSWRSIDQTAQPTIIHSDGGGQYYDKAWRILIAGNNMESSMAEDVYENPNAERLNRTIKEQYLDYYCIKDFRQFKKGLATACLNYNLRPHKSLNKLSPDQFEEKHFLKFSTKSTS